MRRVAVLASAALVCVLLTLRAQEPSQQPAPTFRAGVDIVQLDVSVLDGDRRPVRGLTAGDFTVLENGVALPIVAFEAVDIPGASELPASWMREAAADVVTNDSAPRRIVVIVFDDAFMPLDAGETAKRIARDVVLQLGPNDLAAVTFTDSGKRQNITSNRQRLQRAIDSLVPHPANSQPRMFSASRGASGSFTIPRGGSHCYLRGKYRGPAACVIDTFVTAGEALRQAPPGRKTLVYISAGPPLDLEMTDLRGESNPGEVVLGVQAALKALQEANVSVYAVDPSGVTPDGIMAPRLESLRLFGYDTGGRATLFTNTPWEAVPQIFRESSSYYMLGMRVSQTDEAGRFHRVQVSVNRPGVEVRARTGYYTPASERASAAARPTSPLDNAIGQVVPGGALPLALTLSPFAVPGERDAALAIVTALSEPLEQGPNTVELGVIALDADCGDCRNLPSERGRFTLAPSSSGSEHAEFLSRLELRPGSYEIRAAATLDGRSGGVFAHVDIPDYRKERLSASGLVLGASGSPSPARRDVLADLIPVIPTALREFRPDAEVEAFLRIYQGGSRTPGAVRVNATIRDAADRIVLDHTIFIEGAQFADSRSADYRLELPISMLDSGPHLLTVEAHLATGVVRRDAQFTVR